MTRKEDVDLFHSLSSFRQSERMGQQGKFPADAGHEEAPLGGTADEAEEMVADPGEARIHTSVIVKIAIRCDAAGGRFSKILCPPTASLWAVAV